MNPDHLLVDPAPGDEAGPAPSGAINDPGDGPTAAGPTPARLAAGLLMLAALGSSALGLAAWGGTLWRRTTGTVVEAPRGGGPAPGVETAGRLAAGPARPEAPLTERERYLAWWVRAGPNGRCPAPRCGRAMKVPTRGTARYLCPACGAASPARSIRAMGAPPPPPTPPAAYLLARGRR